jgi:hypothetical protein
MCGREWAIDARAGCRNCGVDLHSAFSADDEGPVDAALADTTFMMNTAMQHSIGTRPPRGAAQDGPSTYWIDALDRTCAQQRGRPTSFQAIW